MRHSCVFRMSSQGQPTPCIQPCDGLGKGFPSPSSLLPLSDHDNLPERMSMLEHRFSDIANMLRTGQSVSEERDAFVQAILTDLKARLCGLERALPSACRAQPSNPSADSARFLASVEQLERELVQAQQEARQLQLESRQLQQPDLKPAPEQQQGRQGRHEEAHAGVQGGAQPQLPAQVPSQEVLQGAPGGQGLGQSLAGVCLPAGLQAHLQAEVCRQLAACLGAAWLPAAGAPGPGEVTGLGSLPAWPGLGVDKRQAATQQQQQQASDSLVVRPSIGVYIPRCQRNSRAGRQPTRQLSSTPNKLRGGEHRGPDCVPSQGPAAGPDQGSKQGGTRRARLRQLMVELQAHSSRTHQDTRSRSTSRGRGKGIQ
ncbi:hypothetical protein V8C86DRAFT_3028801 [Haematococcus lacustris]